METKNATWIEGWARDRGERWTQSGSGTTDSFLEQLGNMNEWVLRVY